MCTNNILVARNIKSYNIKKMMLNEKSGRHDLLCYNSSRDYSSYHEIADSFLYCAEIALVNMSSPYVPFGLD